MTDNCVLIKVKSLNNSNSLRYNRIKRLSLRPLALLSLTYQCLLLVVVSTAPAMSAFTWC